MASLTSSPPHHLPYELSPSDPTEHATTMSEHSGTATELVHGEKLKERRSMDSGSKEKAQQLGLASVAGHGQAGGTANRGQLEHFKYSFFAPELAGMRKVVFKIIIGILAMITVVMWAFVPLFWGSLWHSQHYSDRLTVMLINRDSTSSSSIGTAIVQAALANADGSATGGSKIGSLGYYQVDPALYLTDAEVEHAVVENKVWAAVVITAGATANLEAARQSGNASYDPTAAITFYYNQGRNEQAANTYIVPITEQVLQKATSQWAAQSAATYLSKNAGNVTAIQSLAQAPATITPGVSYSRANLRPYTTPVAAAVTLVGLIYLIIFSFIFCMGWAGARAIISPYLKLSSLLILRITVPILGFLWISLVFAMINLPFKVPFGAHFTYAGGFFLWWMFCWAGMAACGLALEFGIEVFTTKFVGFFLMVLVIVQVSCVSLPWELQPDLYKYGLATPCNRLSNAVRTLIFNTKNELGVDYAIIAAWVSISIITVSLATTWHRRQEVKQASKPSRNDVETAGVTH